MTLDTADAVASVEYGETTWYFCSEDCKQEFEENPEDYAE